MNDQDTQHSMPGNGWMPERAAHRQMVLNAAMRTIGRVAVGLNGVMGSAAEGRPGILMYHRVAPQVRGLPFPLHNVEPDRFREQLSGLLKRGYQFIPLPRLLASLDSADKLPSRAVVVTFDDGFASVYTQAFPVLRDLGIPATVFLNTAYLNGDEPFPFDAWGVACKDTAPVESYRPLTTGECREMQDSGLITLGAHTHTHRDLRGRPDEFRADLAQSVEIVRDAFDLEQVTFAFPYGTVHTGFASDELIDAARSTGVTCGLTTQPRLVDLSESPFRWGRFNSFPWDTAATLSAKLDGWYSWAPKMRRAVTSKLRIFQSSSVAGFASDTLHTVGETL